MVSDKLKHYILNFITVAAIIVLASVIFTSITRGKATVFGYRGFYIVSESMEPTIMTHQIVIGKDADSEDISVGDIVAYKRDGFIIVHRVIDIQDTDDGPVFTFKGDNNDRADTDPVYPNQILYKIIKY